MIIQELIGRRFRRNVYGLSLWEDRIADIHIHLKLAKPPNLEKGKIREFINKRTEAKKLGYRPEIKITGSNSKHSYNINEIIIY